MNSTIGVVSFYGSLFGTTRRTFKNGWMDEFAGLSLFSTVFLPYLDLDRVIMNGWND